MPQSFSAHIARERQARISDQAARHRLIAARHGARRRSTRRRGMTEG